MIKANTSLTVKNRMPRVGHRPDFDCDWRAYSVGYYEEDQKEELKL